MNGAIISHALPCFTSGSTSIGKKTQVRQRSPSQFTPPLKGVQTLVPPSWRLCRRKPLTQSCEFVPKWNENVRISALLQLGLLIIFCQISSNVIVLFKILKLFLKIISVIFFTSYNPVKRVWMVKLCML